MCYVVAFANGSYYTVNLECQTLIKIYISLGLLITEDA